MNLYTEWRELRFGGASSIEVAFRNEDPALLRKCLAKLRELNHRYMIVAARRAPHVIDTYWGRLKISAVSSTGSARKPGALFPECP